MRVMFYNKEWHFAIVTTLLKYNVLKHVHVYIYIYISYITWIGCKRTLQTDKRGLSKWSLKVTETSGWCGGSCRVCCCFR